MIPRLFTFVWKAPYNSSETSRDYINWRSEFHPGLVVPGSRPCLRECSCAVGQCDRASGPHYELQNQIKYSKAKVALFFQLEGRIFIKWLFGEVSLLLFIFRGICKPHDLVQNTRIILLYGCIHIYSLFSYVNI